MAEPPLYLLDTNIASFLIRGGNAALAKKLQDVPIGRLALSVVTEAELRFGLARRGHPAGLTQAVTALLQRVESLPWDSAAAGAYATLRAALEAVGKPLGNLDTLIAAHAVATERVLVTNDQSFRQAQGLIIEDWSTL